MMMKGIVFQFRRWQLCKCDVLICQDLSFRIDIMTAWQIWVFYFGESPSTARSTKWIALREIGFIFVAHRNKQKPFHEQV